MILNINKICHHLFVDGFGGMGDAVVCAECGLNKYPEAIPGAVLLAKLQGRYIDESHPDYATYEKKAREARERRLDEEAE